MNFQRYPFQFHSHFPIPSPNIQSLLSVPFLQLQKAHALESKKMLQDILGIYFISHLIHFESSTHLHSLNTCHPLSCWLYNCRSHLTKGLRIWNFLATKNVLGALNSLAICYDNGECVSHNHITASHHNY